jgi:hypothetical protein
MGAADAAARQQQLDAQEQVANLLDAEQGLRGLSVICPPTAQQRRLIKVVVDGLTDLPVDDVRRTKFWSDKEVSDGVPCGMVSPAC